MFVSIVCLFLKCINHIFFIHCPNHIILLIFLFLLNYFWRNTKSDNLQKNWQNLEFDSIFRTNTNSSNIVYIRMKDVVNFDIFLNGYSNFGPSNFFRVTHAFLQMNKSSSSWLVFTSHFADITVSNMCCWWNCLNWAVIMLALWTLAYS